MLESLNHSGYIDIRRKYDCVKKSYEFSDGNSVDQNIPGIEEPILNLMRHFSYDFVAGDLVIHAFESIPEINGQNCIIGHGFDKKSYLFCSQLPVDMWANLYPQTYHQKIDFVIQNYEIGSYYTEAIFDFDELQYFVPSNQVVKAEEEGNHVVFERSLKEIIAFDITVDSVNCHVSFNVSSKGEWKIAHSNMEAFSEIRISFPATSDLDFFKDLYNLVDCVFAFICNRRNTTCLSMKLHGKYPSKRPDHGKIIDCEKPIQSEIYFFNRYREEPEGNKAISETWNVTLFLKHIDNLFKLMVESIFNKVIDEEDEDIRPLSIASIHPSIKRRNLVDLQQSLQIASTFELYVRHYLPVMEKEETHHVVMNMILQEIIEKKPSKKLKDLAKSLSKNLVREPALKDKIWKAYKGYDTWLPLKNCISQEWYKEEEIIDLGQEFNLWRNALAHGKLSYEPNEKTIKAVRLLEHLNYSIILRAIGYADEEIMTLLEKALKR